MPGRKRTDTGSDSEAEEIKTVVTKKSLEEAVALIYEKEVTDSKDKTFGGTKSLRECRLASLKALNLCSAANVFTSESTLGEILEGLRWSLLEDDFVSASKLLEWLLHYGSMPLLPVIWKNAFAIFLNHYSNSEGCLEDFLEMCADQRSPEEKRKLIEMLLTLPDLLEARKKQNSKTKTKAKPVVIMSDDDDNFEEGL
uniref:Uncharacterized protein n=1 Tax=Cuerna arida TaxID=1464854 RepID=A0A1B6G8G2_9HEMI